MPDIWDQAAKELTKEDPWAAAEHQLGKTQARFKTRAQIDKEVTSNPTLLESGALGLERLTGFKPVGDLARWAQASEVEARTAPPQESPGFVRSVVDSFVHPIDAVGKGATQVSAALRADQNLQEDESLTFDEQLGRVAQGTGGALSMLAPIGSLAGVGALGKAGATLVTQGGKAAATQLARSAAAPVAGLAGGAVGGTLSGEATKLMGGGPGAQALAQLSGGITGGSLGARAGYQRAYSPQMTSVPGTPPPPVQPAGGAPAGVRGVAELEADAQRATGVVGVVPRTMREKIGVWAEDQYRQHLNPEHPMNVRERASGAAGERPVDATTGEPLAAYSPARYTAWMRRGSPGVDQEIMDHPMHAELNKLGTLATMKELGLNTAKGVVQTITQGLSPVQQKFEHYLKVRTDLEDLQQGRSMTHGIYKDAAGVEYTPTLAELQNVVATRAPVFGKAAAALYDFRDQFIRKPLLEAGLLKPQTYADFVANYKEHTPQQRALGPTGLFDLELRQTAPHQAPAGQGALGVKVPVMAKKGSGLQAVDVLANVLDEAHQAHRLARANAAGKLVVKPAAEADAQGNIVSPHKVGGEDMVRYPPGVEVNPKQIGLGMDVVRTYENGEFVDTVMPQALAESLRVGIRQGAPTAANKAWDAINGLAKAGFTSLRAGFALVSNVPLTGQEVAAKSRGGLGSAANLVRYAPEWALSRALPHGVKLEGKMGQALGHARANPGPFMRRLIQETEPVPGRILKDAAGNVTGINLTAAFENARRSGAGGALGVMHEGNPRTMAESILYPPNTLGYWARSFRHPLQRLGHLAQRTAHVMSVDELGRIAADRATLTRARGGMVRDKGVLRRYTEEEAQAEGARDAIESLSDFTLLTPTIKGLQLLAPFVNPALQSTRVHAKGMAGHRGVDGQRQEAVAVSAAALGGYLSTLYNLSDPSRAKHFLSMSTDDRSRGWTWVSPDQQDEGPKRFTGHIVALDGPMRVAADAARGVAERQFGAPDKYDTNGARQTLTRALENLSGLSSDESWFLNLGMQLGYGLRPDGSKLDGVRGNAEASDLAKGMARVTGKGPGHMQAVINVVPGSQYVFPRARPRDPYYTTNPAMAPMLEIEKRLRTVPANRVFEERALQRLEAARKRGWK
jgi:hypothetical protein